MINSRQSVRGFIQLVTEYFFISLLNLFHMTTESKYPNEISSASNITEKQSKETVKHHLLYSLMNGGLGTVRDKFHVQDYH